MASPDTETFRDLQAAATSHRGDRVFNRVITAAAFTALLVLAGIAVFLGLQTIPAFQSQGLSFITTTAWDINTDPPTAGIWGMLYGSVLLAVIGLVIAVPASILLSIFMVFIAPKRLASALTNLIDLMAAAAEPVPGLDPDLREHVRQLPGHAVHRRLRPLDHDDPDHHVGDA
jgi:ABC-type phosphate transport system permease subunit